MKIGGIIIPPGLLAINPHLRGLGTPSVTRRKVLVEPRATAAGAGVRDEVSVEIPGLRLTYTLNSRVHWSTRKRVVAHQRAAVNCALALERPPALPCTVAITRVGPRELNDDNATGSAKGVRDAVAAWLGVDDSDARVVWRVAQKRGPYAVRIEVRTTETPR